MCQKANSMGTFLMVSFIYRGTGISNRIETCLVHAHFLMGKIRTGSKFYSSTTDEFNTKKIEIKFTTILPLPPSFKNSS